MGRVALVVAQRWADVWQEILAATIAAVLAWIVAQNLFGHPHPVFAAIIAIVCLAPGLTSHLRHALGLLLGVVTGIFIGQAALALPENFPLLRMAVGVFFSMMVGSAFGFGAVAPGGGLGNVGDRAWP